MPNPMWRRAQMLVEETEEKIARQREIIARQEQRGMGAAFAKQLLEVWEAALVRRTEMRDQMRARAQTDARENHESPLPGQGQVRQDAPND